MTKNIKSLLPQATFCTLFALSLKPRHGYELIKQISLDSQGTVNIGPGALYGVLKSLNDENVIEELTSDMANDRRRYYRLTNKGWRMLNAELKYYKNILKLAEDRKLLSDQEQCPRY